MKKTVHIIVIKELVNKEGVEGRKIPGSDACLEILQQSYHRWYSKEINSNGQDIMGISQILYSPLQIGYEKPDNKWYQYHIIDILI